MGETGAASWLAIAGLGAFHGLNPAMGWLFAVALGMHRRSRVIVLASLAPILVGHAAAVGLALYAAAALGIMLHERLLYRIAGSLLIGWGFWHLTYGHRHRVRVGMRTGMIGLAIWSFLMATAHGAGLMLLPLTLPLAHAASPDSHPAGLLPVALAAVAVHGAAMLAVLAPTAIVVYEWAGLAFLRRGWINLDLLWSAALAAGGLSMLLA